MEVEAQKAEEETDRRLQNGIRPSKTTTSKLDQANKLPILKLHMISYLIILKRLMRAGTIFQRL